MRTKNKTKVYCIRCQQFTNHYIIAHESQKFTPENTPDMQIDFAEGTWEILKCCGCDEVTFQETWVTSEDYNPNTGELEPIVRLYPPRGENILPIKPYYNIPSTLRRIYREVIDCYNNEIYTLCAAGLRAIIEGICIANKIKDGPIEVYNENGTTKTIRSSKLDGKIEGMAEVGLLTKQHAKILHEHRFLGNKAVHELQTPNPEDLKLAIEIVEHTLYNLYELPDKAKQLQRKKQVHPK